jgi:hypothetical protein
MLSQVKEIVQELQEFFGYVINLSYLVMCASNIVQLIAGLTGVAKVLP